MLLEEMEQRIEVLKQVIKQKSQDLLVVPEGSVNIAATASRVQFYRKHNGRRKYIKAAEHLLVEQLCQKDYDEKVLRAAKEELKKLENLYEGYKEKKYESVYEMLHPERKKYVSPAWIPDDEFVEIWEQMKYPVKAFEEDSPEFYTERGERVRSKTEILIANALYKNHIPYRYEAPLKLEGYGIVHPDFTVLNVRLRKEMYYEHMGMMDNEEYSEAALNKILAYEKNGFFPGNQLILTHETRKNPMNSRLIDRVIQEYLL